METFCHQPVPATISSLQMDPISRLCPTWLPGQTMGLLLGKQLQENQFTNRHEKRCEPANLVCGEILKEMWTFSVKSRNLTFFFSIFSKYQYDI